MMMMMIIAIVIITTVIYNTNNNYYDYNDNSIKLIHQLTKRIVRNKQSINNMPSSILRLAVPSNSYSYTTQIHIQVGFALLALQRRDIA